MSRPHKPPATGPRHRAREIPGAKDMLLETLLAMRIMHWCLRTTEDRRQQIEDDIKQHLGGYATA